MKIRSLDAEQIAVLLAAGLSAVIAVTCSAPGVLGRGQPKPVASQRPAAPAPPPAAPARSTSAQAARAPSPKRTVPKPKAGLSLPHFYAALAGLEQKQRKSKLRVAWFGDSHSAADYLPHQLRSLLQKKFGNGGPGFVHLGVRGYRTSGTRVDNDGKWKSEPSNPAASSRQADGVFGLGGFRAVPASMDAAVRIQLFAGAARGRAEYEFLYRAPNGSSLKLGGLGSAVSLDQSSGKPGAKPSSIRRYRTSADLTAKLDISSQGSPELFGAIIESSGAGVVVDTLAINGARTATPLAYDAAQFRAELKARNYELFVLAYGTNEVATQLTIEGLSQKLRQLVAELKQAAPDADCLVVGPPDFARGGGTHPRVLEIDTMQERTAGELGCGYFSSFHAMGGDGSFERWLQETPALAAPDRVHLTAKGYEKLGRDLAGRVLTGYAAAGH